MVHTMISKYQLPTERMRSSVRQSYNSMLRKSHE